MVDDYLQFILDGVEQAAIGGEPDWEQVYHYVPAGSHTLRWAYTKDERDDDGSEWNAGWVDEVAFTSGNEPVIIDPPLSHTISSGDYMAFSMSAGGAPPLGYQWQRNLADIPGATNFFLPLALLEYGDAATYSVVVRNSFGSVASQGARPQA